MSRQSVAKNRTHSNPRSVLNPRGVSRLPKRHAPGKILTPKTAFPTPAGLSHTARNGCEPLASQLCPDAPTVFSPDRDRRRAWRRFLRFVASAGFRHAVGAGRSPARELHSGVAGWRAFTLRDVRSQTG